MIIDSHLYVWGSSTRLESSDMPWLPGEIPSWREGFSLDAVHAEMTDLDVGGVVLVQAANNLAHTDELLQAAASSRRPARVVGWLPLTEPDEVTAALQRYARHPALRGVRHRILDDDDPAFLLQPTVAKSLELITEAGLRLDVSPWPATVLGQLPVLARRHPQLPIVLNLLGWPEIRARRMQPWTDQMAAAAAESGVYVKVGGLQRMTDDPDAWIPYVETVIELFGPERIKLSGDWPTVMAFGHGYTQSMRAVLGALGDLTPAERAEVEAGTARRVYGFGPTTDEDG